jgi:hypothetical protein
LSQQQARWQEFMSQFEMNIHYVKGEDNTVADALSRLPVDESTDKVESPVWWHDAWLNNNSINVTLSISADESFLHDVKKDTLRIALQRNWWLAQRYRVSTKIMDYGMSATVW